MSLFNPLSWNLDFFLLQKLHDPSVKALRRERIALAAVYLSIFALSAFWLALVTRYVPEPYLDEVFHIPQAQAYCRGEFSVWDPKLTTPPGLYVISTALIRLIKGGSCTVLRLRATNTLILVFLLPVIYGCRRFVTGNAPLKRSTIDWDAVHTAVNICLFPPVFFFSGLYYTDVLSTFIVIKAYEHFLRSGSTAPKFTGGVATYLIGTNALLMRQTNIFWVAVFLGGLELARSFQQKVLFVGRDGQGLPRGWLNELVTSCDHGAFHDPLLEQADASDLLLCATSLAAVAITNPVKTAKSLWPYIILLVSFAGFVLWNGGVVLGDKSNHVATVHLPQMLYVWPFIAFFSLPLLLPSILDLLLPFLGPLRSRTARFFNTGSRPEISTLRWLFVGTFMAIGVIHFNTIIHPFTLADNRHYMFYVFRYTIRQNPMVKYLLAPIYTGCAYFVFRTLAGYCLLSPDVVTIKEKNGILNTSQPGQSSTLSSSGLSSFPRTSFTLVWLISTALSLITAPLVEPRYFIIPWVIWRLNVPSLPLLYDAGTPTKDEKSQTKKKVDISTSCWAGWIKYWTYEGHDYRLWLETIWFLFISLVTGCIFLFNGFEWPQEPGNIQRFMW